MKNSLPASLGYWMPPEWHPHQGTWLTWPKNPITWPDCLSSVQTTYLKIMQILAPYEQIHLLVDDSETREHVRARLARREVAPHRIHFHEIQTVDSWIRDYGPNFLLRETDHGMELAYNDWVFNAWGHKYADLKQDGAIPEKLESVLNVPRFQPGIVLEGGAIEVNGAGTCLTTEQCLLNPNRNPELSRSEVEQYLKDYLAVEQILWLGEGIAGDDTDGHVDDLARFVSPEIIVCTLAEDPADENYRPLRDNWKRLKAAVDRFEIFPLPMPQVVEGSDGPLPATYANFYIANQLVLVPVFNDPNDERALHILDGLFEGRNVIGIDCTDLVKGMGTLHCLSLQQPGL